MLPLKCFVILFLHYSVFTPSVLYGTVLYKSLSRAAPPVKEDPKKSEEQASASTAVINYTYFDSARRDTILPTHKKKTLTAADVMKSDSKATDS